MVKLQRLIYLVVLLCILFLVFAYTVSAEDTVSPEIVSTVPANGTTGINPNDIKVTINYSENVVWGTREVFIKDKAGNVVARQRGATLGKNQESIFTYSRLKSNTKYTLVIPESHVKDSSGNLNKPYSCSFTTKQYAKTIPFKVESTYPENGAKLSLNELLINDNKITIQFSSYYSQYMSNKITIKDSSGNLVSADEYAHGYYIEFSDIEFKPNTKYTVTIPAGALVDEANNPIEAHSFSFTTLPESNDTVKPTVVNTLPSDRAANVGTDVKIIIEFSEEIEKADNAYLLNIVDSKGEWVMGCSVKIEGSKVIIQPPLLTENETYTVNISNYYLQDKAGNFNDDFSICFSTGPSNTDPAKAPLTILSTLPVDKSTDVNSSSEIVITFPETIKRSQRFGSITINGKTLEDMYESYEINGSELSFSPYLELGTSYTISIPTGFVEGASGNQNQAYSFSFTTANEVKPKKTWKLIRVFPFDLQENVSINTPIILDLPIINMDGSIVDEHISKIVLSDITGKSISFKHEIRNNEQLIIYPERLLYMTKYSVEIPEGALQYTSGDKILPCSFSFTTGSSNHSADLEIVQTYPSNGETDVNINEIKSEEKLDSTILIDFSRNVVPLDSFYFYNPIVVKDENDEKVSYGGSYDGHNGPCKRVGVSVDTSKMKNNMKYTITIPEGCIRDESGNLNKPYTFTFTTGTHFSDISSQHWACKAVTEMSKNGVISGYPDGSFKPDSKVTREQFSKMMVLALDLPVVEPDNPTFIDTTKDSWSFKYVESVKEYMPGDMQNEGSYFKGEMDALREDVACALVRAKGLENEAVNISRFYDLFKDSNRASEEKAKYILIAYDKGLITGYSDKTFRPQGTLTRAEAAMLLYKACLK